MKLSQKIQQLRKTKHITQEELGERCFVSRQAVAKWEAGAAAPEADKLLLLSNIFGVTTDVLLKDELAVDCVTPSACHTNCVSEKGAAAYAGLLIKESIDDENILDHLSIHKAELWRTESKPKYWTALTFTSQCTDLPERFARVMRDSQVPGESWFVDFKSGNTKYIVFRNLILKYDIGNREQKAAVCQKCREKGIPDGQMHWEE